MQKVLIHRRARILQSDGITTGAGAKTAKHPLDVVLF